MEKNFKRVFLKTTFFMLCWSFLHDYLQSLQDPYKILYTYSADVWLLLDLGLSKIFDFYYLYEPTSQSKNIFRKKWSRAAILLFFHNN